MKAKLSCLKISWDKADSPNQSFQRRQTAGDVGACLQEGPGSLQQSCSQETGDKRLGGKQSSPQGPAPQQAHRWVPSVVCGWSAAGPGSLG